MPQSPADNSKDNMAAPFPSAPMTPPVRPPDDQLGTQFTAEHAALSPAAWQEQMRAAMERAAAAVAHASRLVRRHSDDMPPARTGQPLSERLMLSDARFRALISVTGHVQWSV